MTSIAVIDYGMGNLRSVAQALELVAPQCAVLVTQQRQHILQAGRVVFPGQGSMRDCVRELERLDLYAAHSVAQRSKASMARNCAASGTPSHTSSPRFSATPSTMLPPCVLANAEYDSQKLPGKPPRADLNSVSMPSVLD